MHHLLFSLCLAAVLGVGTYPDIEENQIVHEYNYSSPSYLFRMNWGWDGFYNGALYSIQPQGWTPGSHQFSLNNVIITEFTN